MDTLLTKPSVYQYTSRTEIENWQKCKRAYFFRKVYGGRGIVPFFASVPLATGSAIHKGVETMALQILSQKPVDVTLAIKAGKEYYAKEVGEKLLSETLSERQAYVKREQSALIAALIRVWHKAELPRLQAEYRIKQSEQSLAFNLSDPYRIRFMSKADLTLESLETSEPYIYSLKTVKEWTPRAEASYNTDLQGLTESMGAMFQRKEWNQRRAGRIKEIKARYKAGELDKEQALGQIGQVPGELIEQVMGVRFCFLVKGKRWPLYGPDGEIQGKWTDSPFLYGYRRQGPGEIEYAHSDKVYRPENKSGFGKLGKGWEKFSVYDGGEASKAVGGIKGWIEMLASGELQPELDNPLQMSVITPVPRFPHKEELDSALVQIKSEAEAAEEARQRWLADQSSTTLDREYPQTRRNCHWPTDCDYLYACYKASPGQDLLDPMSPYEERKPHHDVEEFEEEEMRDN